MPRHTQVRLSSPLGDVDVDAGMSELLHRLHGLGVATLYSCQGGAPVWHPALPGRRAGRPRWRPGPWDAYVMVPSPADAERLVRALHRGARRAGPRLAGISEAADSLLDQLEQLEQRERLGRRRWARRRWWLVPCGGLGGVHEPRVALYLPAGDVAGAVDALGYVDARSVTHGPAGLGSVQQAGGGTSGAAGPSAGVPHSGQ